MRDFVALSLKFFRKAPMEPGRFVMKILIVDDDPVCLRVMRQILVSQSGNEVDCAPSGADAWVKLADQAKRYDVVFLDISMPEVGGLEVLERMRATPTLKSVPVIMCTSAADRATVLKAVQTGAHHYIVKPAAAQVVLAKLKHALEAAARTSPAAVAAS